MTPYFTLLFTLAIATLFDGKKIDKVIFFALTFFMFVFSALRIGGTGPGDYDAYLRLYSLIDTFEKVINPEVHAEIGFRFLSFFGNYWGFNEQYIIIAMAILALMPVVYVIYKYSPYKILSLIVWMPYFLTMNMHSSRTSVAAAFGLLFISLYYNKKWLFSLLCLAVAVSFHSSALILLCIFLAKLGLKKIIWILFVALSILIFVSPFDLLLNIFNTLGLTKFSDFLLVYLSSEDYGYPMKIYDPRIILGMILCLIILKYQKYILQNYDIYFFKIYILGILMMVTFSSVMIMAWRVSYFLLLVSVLVIPWLAKLLNNIVEKNIGSKRVASFIFTLIYCLYTIPIILQAEPYEFFLD